MSATGSDQAEQQALTGRARRVGRLARTGGRAPIGRQAAGRLAALTAVVALASAGTAWAFQPLPPEAQVNDDLAAGIDQAKPVSGEEPTNADVVGGSLTAGNAAVPWAIFWQATSGADQIFVRSFAGGAWTTRGNGTVSGRSSESSQFSGSLNFDQKADGEAPAIDFAGAGRTVPWATWYEQTEGTGFNSNNIFASRFDNTGDANQGKWLFAGQPRGNGGSGPPVPSLNIHTDQSAENPSVAGGSADPTKPPGPWVTWQETSPVGGKDQIYVERPIGPGAVNCNEATPRGVVNPATGEIQAIGGFCWQQVGIPRFGPGGADPSLNVDPTRDGVEPDIAFTGANDTVPWVVWYEQGAGTLGLRSNEMLFAAKGVSDGVSANGGFHWVVVGSGLSGELNTEGVNKLGPCAESTGTEEECSLNNNPTSDAEDPRVAAGTMNPANPTVPWTAWDEEFEGVKQIFVARLVGGTRFELANNGSPISLPGQNATRPDITFSGNTPYVSWREQVRGKEKGFFGHFVNAANPTFVLDESDVPLAPTIEADVREPISSSCTATPFNADGAACQGGAVGTPFFLFTDFAPPSEALLGLFAGAYQPVAPVTGIASGISASSAIVIGTVNPEGASVNVFFEYGTTTAYGQRTAAQKTAPNDSTTPFAGALTGLPAGTTIHYRSVAASDFGTFVGGDQTLRTASPIPPPLARIQPAIVKAPPIGSASLVNAKSSGTTASVRVTCKGSAGSKCKLGFRLSVIETFRGHKLISVSARAKLTHKLVVLGVASATLNSGETRTVRVALNRTGKRLLAKRHKLKVRLAITQTLANGKTTAILSRTLTFKSAAKHHH